MLGAFFPMSLNLKEIRKLAKADRHNHSVLGGQFADFVAKTGLNLPPPPLSFAGIKGMNAYLFGGLSCLTELRYFSVAIKLAFEQALRDGVELVEMSVDTGLIRKIGLSPQKLVSLLDKLHGETSPNITFLPQLGFAREAPITDSLDSLESLASTAYFYSIDLYGDESYGRLVDYQPLFARASSLGLKKSCHIGETGSSDHILRAVNLFELDAIQHGISASRSPTLMKELAKLQIPLNLCPTSNLKLGYYPSISDYPLRTLLDHGVKVTLATDDVLLFGDGISEQAERLVRKGLISQTELVQIFTDSLTMFV